jgi:hypothetical protein
VKAGTKPLGCSGKTFSTRRANNPIVTPPANPTTSCSPTRPPADAALNADGAPMT